MEARIIDLDGSLFPQRAVAQRTGAVVYPARHWGPRIRLACSFRRFRRFEQEVSRLLGETDAGPHLTWYGSGDFHHVSLALLRRLTRPVNLLVLDNHPDWMRFVPFLHCGTWLWHAARLPQVRRIFHIGGDVDFDNAYRCLAPWSLIRSGKIVVIPATRRYERFPWSGIACEPLRIAPEKPANLVRVAEVLQPFRNMLGVCPLYISLDKDVMAAADSVVNWDSGRLTLGEVKNVLDAACGFAGLTGMDIIGDWSPVVAQGWFRQVFHQTMHPALDILWEDAARRNQATNLALLDSDALKNAWPVQPTLRAS